MWTANQGMSLPGATRGVGLAFADPIKIATLDAGDEATVLEAARQLGGVPIDLLISNAGIGVYTTFETAEKDGIMKTIGVNALDPFGHVRSAAESEACSEGRESCHCPANIFPPW
ncbi:unnamed protein product [Phytophthora fragariaefolia]|uniref:Unnamed protein product n=1 Tax=Phytophthora fragariaefolia TaxID=1490495 RepID=A0A9W6XZH9_9STRA|nr:unnamed protein product [Phytophthora fragariaefolia]